MEHSREPSSNEGSRECNITARTLDLSSAARFSRVLRERHWPQRPDEELP
jgi:hypothetical protein